MLLLEKSFSKTDCQETELSPGATILILFTAVMVQTMIFLTHYKY